MRELARSVALFRLFRLEGSAPWVFYDALARDSVAQLERYTPLGGATVLDVGGGPGYTAEAFAEAGAHCVVVDASAAELTGHGRRAPVAAIGDGTRLPVADGAVDVSFSSNVLEHVADPTRMLAELVRVVKPGGIVYVSFTNWLSPWGGHETSPWHYLGGERAVRRFERSRGRSPKNRYGESLFPVHVATALRWARDCAAVEVLDAYPRYLPRWTRPLVSVPGVRELVTWNLAVVLRRVPSPLLTFLHGEGAPGQALHEPLAVPASPADLPGFALSPQLPVPAAARERRPYEGGGPAGLPRAGHG